MGNKNLHRYISAFICFFFLAACQPLWGNPGLTNEISTPLVVPESATPTPFQPESYSPPPTVTAIQIPAEPTQSPMTSSIWISPAVPDYLRQIVLASGSSLAPDQGSASVRLDVSQSSDSQSATWIYALVVPFPTTTDSVSFADIQNAWAGVATGPFARQPIWMDETTLAAFSALWGAPAAGTVQVESADKLIDSAWAVRPVWAIVPFEALEPRWKVLSVDDQSPIHNDFNADTYPLKISFNLQPAAFPSSTPTAIQIS